MSAETIPSEVATDLDCIRWYVECLDAVAFKRRAVAGLAEAEGSYNAAMKRLADRATRPAEPAAPVAEAGDGEVAAWRWRLKAEFNQPWGPGAWVYDPSQEWMARKEPTAEFEALVRLSTLEAERARADAAEQCAAEALARAEKAERERDAYHDALTHGGDTKALMIGEFFEEVEVRNPDYDDESLDEDEDDEPEFITHRVPVSWTTTKAMMERLRSYAHRLAASREAQPATDGGDNG